MPKRLERKLRAQAKEKGFGKERTDAYVYGTMNKLGLMKGGGYLSGAPHSRGGIPILAEGGEFVIRKDSVNRSTLDTLEYINRHGNLPMSDARKRGKK